MNIWKVTTIERGVVKNYVAKDLADVMCHVRNAPSTKRLAWMKATEAELMFCDVLWHCQMIDKNGCWYEVPYMERDVRELLTWITDLLIDCPHDKELLMMIDKTCAVLNTLVQY